MNCAIEAAPVSRIITEVETESGTEFEVEVGVGEPGTEDKPQGTIWSDEEIEKIDTPKKKGKKEDGKKDGGKKPGTVRVKFTKIAEKIKEGLIEFYEDIAVDEPVEKK